MNQTIFFSFFKSSKDIKDVILATTKAIDAPSGVYNVGTGRATSFNKLAQILQKELGKAKKIEYIDNPYEIAYQTHTLADTVKAEKNLGFRAQYSLEEGIKDYLKSIK